MIGRPIMTVLALAVALPAWAWAEPINLKMEPGKEVTAKVKGILTIKQKPVETVADARVTYIKLTPEQVETQKRFGFASENIKVRSTLGTTFSNHGMSIPQLMFLKLSNEISIETDLTFGRQ